MLILAFGFLMGYLTREWWVLIFPVLVGVAVGLRDVDYGVEVAAIALVGAIVGLVVRPLVDDLRARRKERKRIAQHSD